MDDISSQTIKKNIFNPNQKTIQNLFIEAGISYASKTRASILFSSEEKSSFMTGENNHIDPWSLPVKKAVLNNDVESCIAIENDVTWGENFYLKASKDVNITAKRKNSENFHVNMVLEAKNKLNKYKLNKFSKTKNKSKCNSKDIYQNNFQDTDFEDINAIEISKIFDESIDFDVKEQSPERPSFQIYQIGVNGSGILLPKYQNENRIEESECKKVSENQKSIKNSNTNLEKVFKIGSCLDKILKTEDCNKTKNTAKVKPFSQRILKSPILGSKSMKKQENLNLHSKNISNEECSPIFKLISSSNSSDCITTEDNVANLKFFMNDSQDLVVTNENLELNIQSKECERDMKSGNHCVDQQKEKILVISDSEDSFKNCNKEQTCIKTVYEINDSQSSYENSCSSICFIKECNNESNCEHSKTFISKKYNTNDSAKNSQSSVSTVVFEYESKMNENKDEENESLSDSQPSSLVLFSPSPLKGTSNSNNDEFEEKPETSNYLEAKQQQSQNVGGTLARPDSNTLCDSLKLNNDFSTDCDHQPNCEKCKSEKLNILNGLRGTESHDYLNEGLSDSTSSSEMTETIKSPMKNKLTFVNNNLQEFVNQETPRYLMPLEECQQIQSYDSSNQAVLCSEKELAAEGIEQIRSMKNQEFMLENNMLRAKVDPLKSNFLLCVKEVYFTSKFNFNTLVCSESFRSKIKNLKINESFIYEHNHENFINVLKKRYFNNMRKCLKFNSQINKNITLATFKDLKFLLLQTSFTNVETFSFMLHFYFVDQYFLTNRFVNKIDNLLNPKFNKILFSTHKSGYIKHLNFARHELSRNSKISVSSNYLENIYSKSEKDFVVSNKSNEIYYKRMQHVNLEKVKIFLESGMSKPIWLNRYLQVPLDIIKETESIAFKKCKKQKIDQLGLPENVEISSECSVSVKSSKKISSNSLEKAQDGINTESKKFSVDGIHSILEQFKKKFNSLNNLSLKNLEPLKSKEKYDWDKLGKGMKVLNKKSSKELKVQNSVYGHMKSRGSNSVDHAVQHLQLISSNNHKNMEEQYLDHCSANNELQSSDNAIGKFNDVSISDYDRSSNPLDLKINNKNEGSEPDKFYENKEMIEKFNEINYECSNKNIYHCSEIEIKSAICECPVVEPERKKRKLSNENLEYNCNNQKTNCHLIEQSQKGLCANGLLNEEELKNWSKENSWIIINIKLSGVLLNIYSILEKFGKKCKRSLHNMNLKDAFSKVKTLELCKTIFDEKLENLLSKNTRLTLHHLIASQKELYTNGLSTKEYEKLYETMLMLHGVVEGLRLIIQHPIDCSYQYLKRFVVKHSNCTSDEFRKIVQTVFSTIESSEKIDLIHPKAEILKREFDHYYREFEKNKVLVLCDENAESISADLRLLFDGDATFCTKFDHELILNRLSTQSNIVISNFCENNLQNNRIVNVFENFDLIILWDEYKWSNVENFAKFGPKFKILKCFVGNKQIENIELETEKIRENEISEAADTKTGVADTITGVADNETGVDKSNSDNGRNLSVVDESSDDSKNPLTSTPKELVSDSRTTKPKISPIVSSQFSVDGTQSEKFRFIGYDKLASVSEVHYLLNTEYNVEIIERRKIKIEGAGGKKVRGDADLIIDERTGVVIQAVNKLGTDENYCKLLENLILISMQYCAVYVIFYVPAKVEMYPFRSNALKSLSKIATICSKIPPEKCAFKILYAYNATQIASLIRKIAEIAQISNPVSNKEEWIKRPWLTSSISSHEELLLSFPCLNPMAAQIMLAVMPLKKLLTVDFNELQKSLPWIPKNVLLTFHQIVRLKKEILGDILSDEQSLVTNDSPEKFDFCTGGNVILPSTCEQESNKDTSVFKLEPRCSTELEDEGLENSGLNFYPTSKTGITKEKVFAGVAQNFVQPKNVCENTQLNENRYVQNNILNGNERYVQNNIANNNEQFLSANSNLALPIHNNQNVAQPKVISNFAPNHINSQYPNIGSYYDFSQDPRGFILPVAPNASHLPSYANYNSSQFHTRENDQFTQINNNFANNFSLNENFAQQLDNFSFNPRICQQSEINEETNVPIFNNDSPDRMPISNHNLENLSLHMNDRCPNIQYGNRYDTFDLGPNLTETNGNNSSVFYNDACNNLNNLPDNQIFSNQGYVPVENIAANPDYRSFINSNSSNSSERSENSLNFPFADQNSTRNSDFESIKNSGDQPKRNFYGKTESLATKKRSISDMLNNFRQPEFTSLSNNVKKTASDFGKSNTKAKNSFLSKGISVELKRKQPGINQVNQAEIDNFMRPQNMDRKNPYRKIDNNFNPNKQNSRKSYSENVENHQPNRNDAVNQAEFRDIFPKESKVRKVAPVPPSPRVTYQRNNHFDIMRRARFIKNKGRVKVVKPRISGSSDNFNESLNSTRRLVFKKLPGMGNQTKLSFE